MHLHAQIETPICYLFPSFPPPPPHLPVTSLQPPIMMTFKWMKVAKTERSPDKGGGYGERLGSVCMGGGQGVGMGGGQVWVRVGYEGWNYIGMVE